MAKAKRKNSSRKRKSTQTRNNTQAQSNLIRVCLLLCFIAMAIIAMMQFGLIGNFLYRFVYFFFGTLTLIVLACFILFCLFQMNAHKDFDLSIRYKLGILFFVLAMILFLSIGQCRNMNPSISSTLQSFPKIFSNQSLLKAGLFGVILYSLFTTLFDIAGSYLIASLFFLMGILMFSYDKILEGIKARKEKPKQEKVIKKTKREKESSSEEKEIDIDDILLDLGQAEDLHPFDDMDEPINDVKDVSQTMNDQVIETNDEVQHYMHFKEDAYRDYQLPSLKVLDPIERKSKNSINGSTAKEQGRRLIEILKEFGIEAQLVQIHIGPSVTKFEIKPELGVRVNKISNLQYDIKMGLAATDIRIEAPIPGKNAVGIEIPNVENTMVQMKDLMMSIPSKADSQKLLFCVGKDLMGKNVYGRLDKMPHLLIAGATGSGKSVCVNSIICSLLLRTRPDEVKLVLIDPKKVEFTPYKDVPHLIAPVITDGDMANKALKVVVAMMDRRYDLFGETGVRNIASYNKFVQENPDSSLKPLPSIIVIIDELADLMLVAAKEVEASIQRITQLARAAGIHLIVATQRPSVDVITGVIKANIPSRIAFAVSQAVDSRTILDSAGAERLLGNGDMLYLPNGKTSPDRIQGVYIKDEEVNRISEYVKSQGKPQYDDAFIQLRDIASQGGQVKEISSDPLYDDVKKFVIQSRKASTSLIQRRFSVGYSRAARLIDCLELEGIIGPAQGSKPREILVQNTLESSQDDL